MSELEIVKAVVTANPVDFVVGVVDAAREHTPDARLDKAFQAQVNDIVLQLAKEWDEEQNKGKQRPLKEDVEKGLLRLADAYHDARNNRKRRMLYNAFYSYFRPDFYDEGISEMLWEKVQDLEYPDLIFLDKVLKETKPEMRTGVMQEGGFGGRGTWKPSQLPIYENTVDAECADRLERVGLVKTETNGTHGVVLVSWRGVAQKLKEFALTEFWKEDRPEAT